MSLPASPARERLGPPASCRHAAEWLQLQLQLQLRLQQGGLLAAIDPVDPAIIPPPSPPPCPTPFRQ
ncbi:MAG: hypothetical protein LBK99_02340 [Opitutaceae bacterium]|nr:hypothetical protein [Opitutaceae bacterium]